ncbi:MAG: TerB family tellurite resistance protein [Deltaproteobacteria bacterium]|nr:TerB family tellurite resistance protein [Deltaproteobacteria bacterium]
MKRLTISADACIETLALLVAMAWADGRLDDTEKAGVRAASEVFNLTKELRDRLDQILQSPMPVDELLVENLSARDKAFAFVAAVWLSGVDSDVDEKEQKLLDQAASLFGFDDGRKKELTQIARDLEPLRKGEGSWTKEIVTLFKAIPARLEGGGSDFEVSFE